MEQSQVIKIVTDLFCSKLEALSTPEEKFIVYTDDASFDNNDKTAKVRLTLLGLEQNNTVNMLEKIRQKEEDKDGNIIEFFSEPATLVNLKYMITPFCSNKADTYKLLGKIIKLFKEEGSVNIDGVDWIENNNKPVKIQSIQDMDINKQIRVVQSVKN